MLFSRHGGLNSMWVVSLQKVPAKIMNRAENVKPYL